MASDPLASLGFSNDDYNALLASIEHNAPVASTAEPPKDDRLAEFDFGESRQLVFHYGVAEYAVVIERLQRIREEHQLENNSQVFNLLLDEYERQKGGAA